MPSSKSSPTAPEEATPAVKPAPAPARPVRGAGKRRAGADVDIDAVAQAEADPIENVPRASQRPRSSTKVRHGLCCVFVGGGGINVCVGVEGC